jgi:PhnB protein
MPQPIPYLAFNGDCAAAMAFYQQVLGGELFVMTGGDSPMADQIPPEHRHRVIHARLTLDDGLMLYGGDSPATMPYQGMHGVSLSLNYDAAEEGETVFSALADGGRVDMPYAETFWAKRFGMVTDRFGCHWMVNGGLHDVSAQG